MTILDDIIKIVTGGATAIAKVTKIDDVTAKYREISFDVFKKIQNPKSLFDTTLDVMLELARTAPAVTIKEAQSFSKDFFNKFNEPLKMQNLNVFIENITDVSKIELLDNIFALFDASKQKEMVASLMSKFLTPQDLIRFFIEVLKKVGELKGGE